MNGRPMPENGNDKRYPSLSESAECRLAAVVNQHHHIQFHHQSGRSSLLIAIEHTCHRVIRMSRRPPPTLFAFWKVRPSMQAAGAGALHAPCGDRSRGLCVAVTSPVPVGAGSHRNAGNANRTVSGSSRPAIGMQHPVKQSSGSEMIWRRSTVSN